ncbi:MAG: DNA primase [bacterium]
MAYRIPNEIIDEVRSRTDIVDLVSDFVPLKKRGKNFFGLCPFHPEKTPSFSVNPERQIYHCFGCGVGGNAFTFLMEYEKLGFWEALTYLAKRANVTLPQKGIDSKQRAENDALFHANQFAADYYRRVLLETEQGARALQYLKERGLSDQTIEAFHLGYAPPGWSNLLDEAQKKSLSPDLLQRAGLAVSREKGGGYYDRFRDRVVFPIVNLTGKVVGFGGRLLSESQDQPKYLNSPETPIYNKGKMLYGLFQARGSIRQADRVVVVEGYTDVISLSQAGIENVVASSGTAFTSDQARLIGRYTRNALLLFDADTAGAQAALRGVETLLDNGLDVHIVSLPAGTDPDSFVREKGKAPLIGLFDGADSFVDFVLKKIGETHDLATVEGMAQAVETVVEALAKIKDEVKRSLWIKRVSEKLSLDERVIQHSVDRARRPRGATLRETKVEIEEPSTQAAEHGLLRLMMAEHRFLRWAMEELAPDDFCNPDTREMATVLFQLGGNDQSLDPALIIDRLNRPGAKSLVSLLSVQEGPGEEGERLFRDYLSFMKKVRVSRELKQVREALEKAQKDREEEVVVKLTARFQELCRLKERLKKGATGSLG